MGQIDRQTYSRWVNFPPAEPGSNPAGRVGQLSAGNDRETRIEYEEGYDPQRDDFEVDPGFDGDGPEPAGEPGEE